MEFIVFGVGPVTAIVRPAPALRAQRCSPQPRHTFAAFLNRLAAGRASAEERQALAVAHYGDAVLEDVRRRCVRPAFGAASWGEWSASELRLQTTA